MRCLNKHVQLFSYIDQGKNRAFISSHFDISVTFSSRWKKTILYGHISLFLILNHCTDSLWEKIRYQSEVIYYLRSELHVTVEKKRFFFSVFFPLNLMF
jgi:hypothetical protein